MTAQVRLVSLRGAQRSAPRGTTVGRLRHTATDWLLGLESSQSGGNESNSNESRLLNESGAGSRQRRQREARLIYRGRELQNDGLMLAEAGVDDGAVVHCSLRQAPSTSTSTTSASASAWSEATLVQGTTQPAPAPSLGPLRGFDRLVRAGFSADEVRTFRVQFHTARGFAGVVSAEALYALEDDWIGTAGLGLEELEQRSPGSSESDSFSTNASDDASDVESDTSSDGNDLIASRGAAGRLAGDDAADVELGVRSRRLLTGPAVAEAADREHAAIIGTYKDLLFGLTFGFVFNILTLPWLSESHLSVRAKLGIVGGIAFSAAFALLHALSQVGDYS